MSDSFRAPMGWESFSNSVVEKTRMLISLGVWEEIDELDLGRWLQNFKSDEEKYLAACILDAFTYRSKKMCHSMMRNILMDLVPNYCRKIGIANFDNIQQWRDRIDAGDNLVRFVPVNISDGRVKSANVVAREFIEANDIPQRFVQQPNAIDRAIENGTNLIVFIDDFAGSGFQFLKFLKQNPINKYLESTNFLYAPLCAHVDAIKRIEAEIPEIRVIPIEILDSSHSFFYECEDGYFRGDGINSVADAKLFYSSLFDNSANTKYLFGMSNQSLTYSFCFSTPNNNIKALYHEEPGIWKRLVFRGRN